MPMRKCDREPASSSAIEAREQRPLMGWFVLRLFADLFFGLDDLIEAVAVVGLKTFFASGHSFIARRQKLSLVLLPRVERFFCSCRDSVLS